MQIEKMIFFVIWQFYRQEKMMRFEILLLWKIGQGLQHSWVQQIDDDSVSGNGSEDTVAEDSEKNYRL